MDVLYVVAVIWSSGPAAAQVEVTPVVEGQTLGFHSEEAVVASPAVAVGLAPLSCRWAESPELMCPCSRSIAERFSGKLCGTS